MTAIHVPEETEVFDARALDAFEHDRVCLYLAARLVTLVRPYEDMTLDDAIGSGEPGESDLERLERWVMEQVQLGPVSLRILQARISKAFEDLDTHYFHYPEDRPLPPDDDASIPDPATWPSPQALAAR